MTRSRSPRGLLTPLGVAHVYFLSSSYFQDTDSLTIALLVYYNGLQISQQKLIAYLTKLETQLGDLSRSKVPSRIFKLPITFDSPKETQAIKRYMETQRPYASYLPDNMEFVAKNNGLERKDLENILLTSKLIAVSVGFFAALPLCLPVDPRERLNCLKVTSVLKGHLRISSQGLADEPLPRLHPRRPSILGRILHGPLQRRIPRRIPTNRSHNPWL